MTTTSLSRGLKTGYGVGSLGTGIFTTVPGLLLLFYLTDVLAVPAATAGFVILLPKIWDFVIDPLIGSVSDRFRSRLGNRRPFMYAGGALLPVFFGLMFAPPDMGPTGTALWVGGFFMLSASAFSLFQVPYIALPAELTTDPLERTRVVAYRMVALTVGILLGGGLAPLLSEAAGGGRAGYRTMGFVIGALAGGAMLASTIGLRRGRTVPPVEEAEPLRDQVRRAARNRPFAFLMGGYFIQNLAVNVMLAGAPFLSLYLLGDETLTAVLFVALVAPAAVFVPVWARVSHRLGKLRSLEVSVVGFAIVVVTMLTVSADRVWLAVVQAGLLGLFYSGTQLMPFSMLPDAIDVDTHANDGASRAGSFTGLWTAGETVGAAVGPFLFAAVLAVTGFVESGDEAVVQTATALGGIRFGFALLPGVLLLASLPIIHRYRPAVSA